MKMKSFAPPFSTKETKHIHASAADVLHTVLEWDIAIGANARSSHWRSSVNKGVLKNFSRFTCARISFLIKLQA